MKELVRKQDETTKVAFRCTARDRGREGDLIGRGKQCSLLDRRVPRIVVAKEHLMVRVLQLVLLLVEYS